MPQKMLEAFKPVVKIENEPYCRFKTLLNVVNSGKSKLVRHLNSLGDLQIKLEIGEKKDPALSTKLDACKTTKSNLDSYMADLKKNLLLWGAITPKDTVEQETIDEVKTTGDTMIGMDSTLKDAISDYRKFA